MAHPRKKEKWLDHARAMIGGKSRAKTAALRGVFTGDVIHHTVQVHRPDWNAALDALPDEARSRGHRRCNSLSITRLPYSLHISRVRPRGKSNGVDQASNGPLFNPAPPRRPQGGLHRGC